MFATAGLARVKTARGDLPGAIALYRDAADRAIATVGPFLARYPTGFANWLSAAELTVNGIVESGRVEWSSSGR